MENKPAISKQDIAKYVQDMAEIEAAEYTLRKAAEEMRRSVDQVQSETEANVDKCQKNLQYNQKYLDEAERRLKTTNQEIEDNRNEVGALPEKPKEPQRPSCWDSTIKEPTKPKISILSLVLIGILAVNILLAVVYGIIAFSLLIILGDKFPESLIIDLIPIALIISVVLYIVGCIFYRKNAEKDYYVNLHRYRATKQSMDDYTSKEKTYKAQLAEYEQKKKNFESVQRQYTTLCSHQNKLTTEIRQYQDKVRIAEKELAAALQKKETESKKRTVVNAQITLINKNVQNIQNKKQALYKANIIPPDYRELDCVLMFHQIFRNDLADTMREAVKIYEERVYRQEVIRGIDKIYQMLGRLSASMSLIENRLVQIRDEVKFMANDIYQISEKLSDIASSQRSLADSAHQQKQASIQLNQTLYAQQRAQEEQLAETRASRYATEALKDATDKLVYYENVKYWQSL